MELKDYIAILRRRGRIFLGVVVCSAAVFAGLVAVEKVVFSGVSRVIISADLANMVDFYGGGGPQFKPGYVNIRTNREQLTSKPVVQLAARILAARDYGLQFRVAPKDGLLTEAEEILAKNGLLELRKASPYGVESLVHRGVEKPGAFGQWEAELSGSVRTDLEEGTQYVTITATAVDGQRALDLANATALAGQCYSYRKALQDIHMALENVNHRLSQNQRMLEIVEKDLGAEADVYLRGKGELDTVSQQIQAEERDIALQRIAMSQSEKESRDLLGHMHLSAEIPDDAPPALPVSPQAESLRTRIQGIELQLAQNESRLRDEHPQREGLFREMIQLRRTLQSVVRSDLQVRLADLQREKDRAEVALQILEATRNEHLMQREELLADASRMQPIIRRRETLDNENEMLSEYRLRFESMQSIRSGFVEVSELGVLSQAHAKRSMQGGLFWSIMTLLVALGLCYLAEYMDTSLMSEYDVRRHLNMPILGIVPFEADQKVLLPDLALRHPIAEIFNTAATLIRSAMEEAGFKSFVVCSAVAKEGKTSISVDLAVAMARKGLRVMLVDSDLRIPTVHSIFGIENSRGLVTLLQSRESGEGPPEDSLLASYIHESGIEGLRVLPSGPSPQSAIRLIESEAMRDVVREIEGICDFVIFDTPPICTVGDTLMLSTMVDACILVVGAAIAEQKDVTWAKHLMDNVSASILGVVLNRVTSGKGTEYYYYYSADRKRVRRR